MKGRLRRNRQKAIEDTPGISLQEYTALAQAAQTDPELVEEINSYMQELGAPAEE